MSLGEIGIGLDRAPKGVPRISILVELDEYEADAIPRDGMLGCGAQHLTVGLERELGVLSLEQTQREVEARFDRRRRRLQSAPERVYRPLCVALVPQQHAEVVLGERVAGVDLQRAIVAVLCFGVATFELESDTASVPRLGGGREFARESISRCDRCSSVPLQQIQLEHRLQHFGVGFSTLDCLLVLAQRFLEVALLAERAAKRDVRAGGGLLLVAGSYFVSVCLERQVCVRTNERRVQHHSASIRLGRFLAAAKITEDEAYEVERVRVYRIQLDGAANRPHRVLVEAAVVERFGEKEMDHRAVRIQLDRPLKQRVGALEATGGLLSDTALDERLEILRVGAQPFLELVQPLLEDSTFAVGNLQISPRNAHALVERERFRERSDRLLGQSLPEIEDTEVVERARIRRIDSASERSEDVDLTAMRGCLWAGSCRWALGVSLRAPRERWRRMRWGRGRAGRSHEGFPPALPARTRSRHAEFGTRRVARGRQAHRELQRSSRS